MALEDGLPLAGPEGSKDTNDLLGGERRTWPFPSELPEAGTLDAQLLSDPFDLLRVRSNDLGNMPSVDTWEDRPVIHNAFWIPGKVPSLNELLDAKSKNQPILRSIIMRQKPVKGKGAANRYSLYNEIKQDWKQRTIYALGTPFVRVQSCYFGYLVVEENMKRDPSNVCSAAIKFIEDGLVEAGVIPNDGWEQVLGIRVHWVLRRGVEPGVFVVMSDRALDEADLLMHWTTHVH